MVQMGRGGVVQYLVFQQLQRDSANSLGVAETETRIRAVTREMLVSTILNVLDHYPTAYPASLFKNASKWRDLAKRIQETSVPAVTP